MHETAQTFIMITGPYRNVGDSLIRRRALVWARDLGQPHVLLSGRASGDWDASLALESTDIITRSRLAWFKSIIRARQNCVFVIEPGEFNTDRRFFKSLAFVAAASLIARARGGRVVQMPRSLARRSRLGDFLYRCTVARGRILWREADSARHYGWGVTVPDIGFDHDQSIAGTERKLLVVSLRGDRQIPPMEWARGIRTFADDTALEIVCLAQVEEDNDRCQELAKMLDAEVDLWSTTTDSVARERHVREVYSRSQIVVSDRLHALIIGAVSGALPAEIVPAPNGKIAKHFSAIGLYSVSQDARGLSPSDIAQTLREAVDAAASTRSSVTAAAQKLASARKQNSIEKKANGRR